MVMVGAIGEDGRVLNGPPAHSCLTSRSRPRRRQTRRRQRTRRVRNHVPERSYSRTSVNASGYRSCRAQFDSAANGGRHGCEGLAITPTCKPGSNQRTSNRRTARTISPSPAALELLAQEHPSHSAKSAKRWSSQKSLHGAHSGVQHAHPRRCRHRSARELRSAGCSCTSRTTSTGSSYIQS